MGPQNSNVEAVAHGTAAGLEPLDQRGAEQRDHGRPRVLDGDGAGTVGPAGLAFVPPSACVPGVAGAFVAAVGRVDGARS